MNENKLEKKYISLYSHNISLQLKVLIDTRKLFDPAKIVKLGGGMGLDRGGGGGGWCW